MSAPPLPKPAAHSRMELGFVVLALSLLMGAQPVTTDMYLPALPALTRHFNAPMTAAQLTLSALIICFGLGQLFWGPLSDRYGRKPILLAGLSLYIAAAVLAALAGSIVWLVGWRAVQGFALAAAVMGARAMVRDLFEPVEGAQIMARALTGLGVIALASPVLGGAAAAVFGWRGALLGTGVFGALTLGILVWRLDETIRQKNPHSTRIAPMLRVWANMLAHPTFRAWGALAACTYAGLYAFLAGSPFVLIEVLGASRIECGIWVATASLCYIAGTVYCRRWIRAHGMAGAVRRGSLFSLAGGLLMLGGAASGATTPLLVMVPQWLYSFGHGVHMPCGQAGVAGPFPANAGAASALAGFVLGLVAFGMGAWLGVAMDGTLLPYALAIATSAGATCAVGLTLVQKHGTA